jgi:hypothetical protein
MIWKQWLPLHGSCIIAFCIVSCNGQEEEPPIEPVGPEILRDSACGVLQSGGKMYAGRVAAVRISKTGKDENFDTFYELGTLDLKVEKTISGPEVTQLTLPFGWQEPEHQHKQMVADMPMREYWPWEYYPAPHRGQRFLVLLLPDGEQLHDASPNRGQVAFVWHISTKDDALVRDFETAAEFLKAEDPEAKKRLFRKLCLSDTKNGRRCAQFIAFSLKPPSAANDSQPREVRRAYPLEYLLEFLELTPARLKGADEHSSLTDTLLGGASQPRYGVFWTDKKVRQFVDNWWMTELAAHGQVDHRDIDRSHIALNRLTDAIEENGPQKTLELFSEAHQKELKELIQKYAQSTDAQLAKKAQEAKKRLGLP